MDFSEFTTENLELMLTKHKEELTRMVLISGLESKAQTIADIEFVIKERKEENGKTKE